MEKYEDFSIVFKSLEEAKQQNDYPKIEETIENTDELQDPIEKLREIIVNNEEAKYTILTTA